MNSKDLPEVFVSAKTDSVNYWREVWRYRELLYILSWRDLKVRYKQTLIGAAWAIIRPLLTMLIFTFVFGRVAGLADDTQEPYPLLVLAGVLAWQLFSSGISESAASLLGNERLITKVYFPKILVPMSTLATCLIDFLVALSLLLCLLVYYGTLPSVYILFLPLWLLLTLALSLSIGLGLSALNIRFRDFRYALPFVLQVGLFLSPVGFSSRAVPEQYLWIYDLNPAVGIIESFRWCVSGVSFGAFPSYSLGITLVWVVLSFWVGFRYFQKTERTFADII
jgi:lipopolysaccharide transport system permease protein